MGASMSNEDDLPQRDRWARLRFAIIGPLLASPPVPGELRAALGLLAAKTWRHPFTGFDIRFGVSTLERWFYAAKRAADPVQALRNQVRRDIGRFPSLSAEAVQALTTQYHEHPGWTAQLHHDNLRVTLSAAVSVRRTHIDLTSERSYAMATSGRGCGVKFQGSSESRLAALADGSRSST
jgi:putative transposase